MENKNISLKTFVLLTYMFIMMPELPIDQRIHQVTSIEFNYIRLFCIALFLFHNANFPSPICSRMMMGARCLLMAHVSPKSLSSITTGCSVTSLASTCSGSLGGTRLEDLGSQLKLTSLYLVSLKFLAPDLISDCREKKIQSGSYCGTSSDVGSGRSLSGGWSDVFGRMPRYGYIFLLSLHIMSQTTREISRP